MNLQQLDFARHMLRTQLAQYERIVPACGNCTKCSSAFHCDVYQAQPPQQWREGPVTCEHWKWDEIPF